MDMGMEEARQLAWERDQLKNHKQYGTKWRQQKQPRRGGGIVSSSRYADVDDGRYVTYSRFMLARARKDKTAVTLAGVAGDGNGDDHDDGQREAGREGGRSRDQDERERERAREREREHARELDLAYEEDERDILMEHAAAVCDEVDGLTRTADADPVVAGSGGAAAAGSGSRGGARSGSNLVLANTCADAGTDAAATTAAAVVHLSPLIGGFVTLSTRVIPARSKGRPNQRQLEQVLIGGRLRGWGC
jgi:hypothetical protein